VRHAKKPAAPVPSQTIADNRQVLEDSLSDELDSVEFLESEDGLAFRRPGVGPDVPRDLRRGRWSVVGQIDLHGMFVDEARDAVAQFLKHAQATERLCVRIIHGKGNGSPNRQSVLREKVRRWLKQRDEVIAFAEPRENDGGAGATLVRLRPQKRH
jgi:DNA-nicking Smr family endonuclease